MNLTGVFNFCRAVVPHMQTAATAESLNIASIAGKEGNPRMAPYSATKAAVIGLTKSLGKELATDGICVNAVAPAVVQTQILDQLTEEQIAYMTDKIPMKRTGKPEEIAAVVHFLASRDLRDSAVLRRDKDAVFLGVRSQHFLPVTQKFSGVKMTNRSMAAVTLTVAALLAVAYGQAPRPPAARSATWPHWRATRRRTRQSSRPRPAKNASYSWAVSITDFWGRRYGKFFPGKPYLNRGISAQITPQMLLRFRQDVVALEPKVVVILAGTNDIGGSLDRSAQATRNNLMSMVDLARANRIRVVLSSLTPVNDYLGPQTEKRPLEKLRELNAWIKDYAARNKIVYLDYWPAMLDEKGVLGRAFTWDGLHPNDAGYEVMGRLAERAIAEALQQKQ